MQRFCYGRLAWVGGMCALLISPAWADAKIGADLGSMDSGLKALDQSIAELESRQDQAVAVNKALNRDDFKAARQILDDWQRNNPGDKAKIDALRDLADRAEKEPDEAKRAVLVGEDILGQLKTQLAGDHATLAALKNKDGDVAARAGQAEERVAGMTNTVYPFTVQTIEGESRSLADYKGKTLLIVNTASKCGFTPQYKGLEALYEQYKDRGLVVLGFPANNFMGQEPGTNAEIKQFCDLKYHVTFPMFGKISVKGDDIAPLYKYLTTASGFNGDITWNFNKFLVDKTGRVVARFGSKTTPEDKALVSRIEEIL